MPFESEGVLLGHGAVGLSLALLLLGHVLADFVFQSKRLVAAKDKTSGLLLHGIVVFVVHALAFLPLLSPVSIVVLLFVAVLHVAVDAVKRAWVRRHGDHLIAFFIDQGVHVLVLLAAWYLLFSQGELLAAFLPWETIAPWADQLTIIAILLAAFALNGTGAAAVVSLLLSHTPSTKRPEDAASKEIDGHGRLIGMLERWLVLVFVMAGAWIGIGLVVAAKSIARFDRIRQEPEFAERYLVGTLGSLLVAVIAGIATLVLLGPFF